MRGQNGKIDWNRYLERMDVIQHRQNSGKYDYMTQKQKQLYDTLKEMGDAIIIGREIKKKLKLDRQTWPTDFCYNLVNLEDNDNKYLFRCRKDRFQFVGFDWPGRTDILWTLRPRLRENGESIVRQDAEWKPQKVGFYDGMHFRWNFKALREEIVRRRDSSNENERSERP